jgi:4-amino-4-deoxy-L-arabinose transferase-like glycosyltransferase
MTESREKRKWHRQGVLWICTVILGAHFILLGYGAAVHSPTIDEVAHMAAGVSHWELGRFDLYRVNPPFVRLLATLPVVAAGYMADWTSYNAAPGERREFYLGERFVDLNGTRSFRLFTWARWACIPLSIVGAVVCFLWARDLFGQASGVLAMGLWCFSPTVLGHAQLITPDIGGTALGLAAMYCFWRWLRAPSWYAAYVAGTVLGFAELTKTTLILYFVLYPILWVLWRVLWIRDSDFAPLRTSGAQLGLCLVLALFLLNLGYGFEGTFRLLGDYQFVSHALAGDATSSGNRFAGTYLSAIPVPLPANYVMGVDTQKRDFERGDWSYLHGEWRDQGWWYYYLYGMAVKTPLGLMFLIMLAGTWAVLNPIGRASIREELLLAVPPIAVLALVSAHTGFNHHVRYVLPVYPFVFVSASRVAQSLSRGSWGMSSAWVTACCGILAAVASVYPHSMSYFNELVGGPRHGSEYLVDSNIDWGQDLLYLRQWQQSRPETAPLGFAYFGQIRPEVAQIAHFLPPRAELWERPDSQRDNKWLQPGWYAVSASLLRGRKYRVDDGRGNALWTKENSFRYFERWEPSTQAGYSIYIYHVTPEQSEQLRRELSGTESR